MALTEASVIQFGQGVADLFKPWETAFGVPQVTHQFVNGKYWSVVVKSEVVPEESRDRPVDWGLVNDNFMMYFYPLNASHSNVWAKSVKDGNVNFQHWDNAPGSGSTYQGSVQLPTGCDGDLVSYSHTTGTLTVELPG